MITEACGAVHCGNATVLRSLGKKNSMGQHSKGVVQYYIENHISALHYIQHSIKDQSSLRHGMRYWACLTVDQVSKRAQITALAPCMKWYVTVWHNVT